jgi:hypothetical protein
MKGIERIINKTIIGSFLSLKTDKDMNINAAQTTSYRLNLKR